MSGLVVERAACLLWSFFVSKQADSGVTLATDDLAPEAMVEEMGERQTAWLDKKLTQRGGSAWRPKRMHRLAARKQIRMMDSQLATITGVGISRFRKGKSAKWKDWRRCCALFFCLFVCVVSLPLDLNSVGVCYCLCSCFFGGGLM